MVIKYDIEKLTRALQDFSIATGISISFVDTNLSYLCIIPSHNCFCMAIQSSREGVTRCTSSDAELLLRCRDSKKPEMHICHAGLMDLAVPIFYNDLLLGYLILGQMRTDTSVSDIRELTNGLPISSNELAEKYQTLPVYHNEKVTGIANVAVMLTKYVLFENALKPSYDENVTAVLDFVENNYQKNISVFELSRKINISKTALYKIFRQHFNCTVNEYINARRIEKSLELLSDRRLSIEEISRLIGFSSAAYYSKVFKRQKGISPIKFRQGL